MANERALGISFIYAVQTWRQAAVAEPARLRQDPDRKPVRAECVTQFRGLIRWNRREKTNRLRSATGWT
jgi:hypothetical protein